MNLFKRKFVIGILAFLCLLASSLHSLITPVQGQGKSPGSVVNLEEYIMPVQEQGMVLMAPISSGETFYNVAEEDGVVRVCKNTDCTSFEKRFMTYDGFSPQGESAWFGENTTFQYIQGSFGSNGNVAAYYNSSMEKATWLPTSMQVGEVYSSGSFTVVGFSTDSNGNIVSPIDTPYVGPTPGVQMKLDYVGPIEFPTGVKLADVAKIVVVSGPGAGEVFYYAKGIGWVGWEGVINGQPVNNYINEQIVEFEGPLPLVLDTQTSPPLITEEKFTCSVGGSMPEKGIFRPDPCDNCKLNVPKDTETCAEPTVLSTTDSWTCGDLVPCGDDYWVKYKTWGTGFSLNTENTDVPFAGFHDIVSNADGEVLNLENYLSDYLGGVALYYEDSFDSQNPEDIQRLFAYAGPFRKLTPSKLQDDLRKQRISEGLNYSISDGKTTKHMQDWWPEKPFPPQPYSISNLGGRFPPDENSLTYLEDYANWSKTEWGQLWQRIPLFTREDSPGKIKMEIDHYPGNLFVAGDAGAALTDYSAEFPLAVPHLGRLYQASKNLNELLIPNIEAAKIQLVSSPEEALEPQTCTSIFGPGIASALGCLPINILGVASWITHYGAFVGGGIAFLLMGYGAFLLITSANDPEKIQQGKTIFVAALIGLLTVIGAVFLLRLVVVNILKVPGFSQNKQSNPILTTNSSSITPSNQTVLLAQAHSSQPSLTDCQTSSETLASQPTLLAQGGEVAGGSPVNFEIVITGDPEPIGNNQYRLPYEVKVSSNREGRGIHARIYINGNDPFGQYIPLDKSWEPFVIIDKWLPDLIVSEDGEIQLDLSARVDDAGDLLSPDAARSCTFSIKDGKIVSNCETTIYEEAPKQPACANQSTITPSCSEDNPLEDSNPNDPLCCNAYADIQIPDYIVTRKDQKSYEEDCLCDPILDEGCNPGKVRDEVLHRGFDEFQVELPFLEEIWEKTADDEIGFFNIFRPATWPKFDDRAAVSRIKYLKNAAEVTLSQSQGDLYWPYLGGIQETKECIRNFLLPEALQPQTEFCEAWKDYLKYQPTFDPNQPSGFAVEAGYQLDEMDCQNAEFKITADTKASALAIANNSWPENILEENWDQVVQASKDHGWNPACVVALWIEESGGSHFVATGGSRYSLGCEGASSSDPEVNLQQSLDCFFSRQSQSYYQEFEPGSREWWLVYAEGPGNSGVFDGPQANFPKNLYSWYKRLSN